jgi:DNA recombination protein RmuC
MRKELPEDFTARLDGSDKLLTNLNSLVALVSPLEQVIGLVLGILIGLVLGWLLRSLRKGEPDLRVETELRQQLNSRDSELGALRQQLATAGAATASAEASRVAAERLASTRTLEAADAASQVLAMRERLASTEMALATARAEVEKGMALLAEQHRFHADANRELREKHDAALAELKLANDRAMVALKDHFRALAADALAANGPEFLRLAQETFSKFKVQSDGDLAQRQENIAALVRPLEEQLKSYQQRLQQSDALQQAALGQVREHLVALTTQSQSLSSETQRLRVVLSSNQARGRWGEETLRRVVEAAGLSSHCDFTEQAQEGDGKPDLVVRLPGDRVIIVDSKVPDLDFLDSLSSADEGTRRAALQDHAAKLRNTIRQLADRDYPRHFANALDHVVLFLPAEALFSAALEGDRELIVWAAQRKILLATPASLIALLRSVAISWQQHEQSQNAKEIAVAASDLFTRVSVLVGHFEKIRKGLTQAGDAYNDAVGSYESRVRPAGERILKLGGVPADKQMLEVAPVNNSLRLPPAESSRALGG